MKGDQVSVDGIDPATFPAVYRYDWVQGSNATLAALGRTGAASGRSGRTSTTSASATASPSSNPAGGRSSYVVRGIYTQPKFGSIDPVLGSIAISQRAFDSSFERPQNAYTFLNVRGGASPSDDGCARARAGRLPDAKVADASRLGGDAGGATSTSS